ncbi:MAG TPA: flagellar basal-body rod protein FlgG [Acidobacteriota bacterium]|mgnify:FL=1|nr:flagellar basal-body rod protein FlgG [Acidobacteriota bacterium]
MLRALHSAASGMEAIQLNIDNIANNLANINTTGFKQRRTQFQDLLYQDLVAPGSSASTSTEIPTGLQLGLGTRAVSNEVIFLQGDYVETGNELDLVIEGRGFFQIRLPDGQIAYTRSGAFHLDRDGNLVTASGDPLEPQVNIPREATKISIAADGTVSVNLAGQTNAQQVGRIELAVFANPAGLNSIGRNLYLQTAASGDPVTGSPGENGVGTLLQGFLEKSNVNVVKEMVNLITSQRAYEAGSRVIRTADQMYQQVTNMVR